MNEIINLHFEDAPCRTVVIDGARWWVGKDVCAILGYKNETDAMKYHCRGVAKFYPISDRLGREQDARIISLPDVYRLISGSKLPAAVRFEAWIYETVLPEINKNGSYVPEHLKERASLQKRELYNLLERSEKSLRFLTAERDHLRRENRLLLENKELRERLAKKNTPLTQNERTQIKELAGAMTVAQIARALNRSASAISRILKEGENK